MSKRKLKVYLDDILKSIQQIDAPSGESLQLMPILCWSDPGYKPEPVMGL